MNEAQQWELIGQIEGIIRNPIIDIATKIVSIEYVIKKYKHHEEKIQTRRESK